MLLDIKNLHVHYGAIHALKGVSLEIQPGEIVALIGANGAGKSTLLRTLSGIMKPTSGTILFETGFVSSRAERGDLDALPRSQRDGHGLSGLAMTDTSTALQIHRLPPHKIVANGIAQVPEGRQIFANLTVQENLELGAYARPDIPEWKKEFGHVFRLFPRLQERLAQNAGTLSGGEQQMLAIGRALMSKPKLLLLDEPSLGIAPALVQQIFKTLGEINRQGVSILLVEQDAYVALETAHRAYVLETGTIGLSGPAKELLGHPEVRKAYLGEGK